MTARETFSRGRRRGVFLFAMATFGATLLLASDTAAAPLPIASWPPAAGATAKFVPGLTPASSTGPFVIPGSSYDILLFSEIAFNLAGATATFDGLDESFNLLQGGTVTVSESITSMGGRATIDFTFRGDTDLFPTSLNGVGGFLSVGGFANPLDLGRPLRLRSAILTYRRADGSVFGTGDCAGFVANPDPWDGFFLAPGGFGCGFASAVTEDIREIDLAITVPEPTTVLLIAWAIGASLRRKTRPRPVA